MSAVFEWYNSNARASYPFSDRQADNLHTLFVDAYVIHNKLIDKEQRLCLATFDPAGVCTLRFEDGTLLAALTGGDNFTVSAFGAYTIYSWLRSTTVGAGFTDEDIAVKLVVLTSRLAAFSFPHASTTAFLLGSLVNPRVNRVRRLAVALPAVPCCTGGGITQKQVILEEGFNVNMTVAAAPTGGGVLGILGGQAVRAPRTIVLDAVPGGGIGTYPTCTSLTPPIRKINKQGPDANGNFQLEGRDCTWVERRVLGAGPPVHQNTNYLAVMQAALLQLHENCKVCCACDDYKEAYLAITRAWNSLLATSRRIEQLRRRYHAVRNRVLLAKVAYENGLNVHLRAVSRPDFHLALSAIVYNNSDADLGLTLIEFILDTGDFVYTDGSGLLDMEGYRNVMFDPAVAGNVLSVTIPSVPKVGYSVYSFEVRYGPEVAANRAGLIVHAKARASSGAYLVEEEKAVALTGPLVKK